MNFENIGDQLHLYFVQSQCRAIYNWISHNEFVIRVELEKFENKNIFRYEKKVIFSPSKRINFYFLVNPTKMFTLFA